MKAGWEEILVEKVYSCRTHRNPLLAYPVVDLPTFESSPLPVRHRITSYGKVIDAAHALRVCEKGKSFVVDKQSHCKRIQGIAKRLSIAITTQKIEDGKYRIWSV